jgi:hypothetical protein
MEKNNIDETLIEWNTILEEIRGESELLIKDLSASVNYVATAGILVILLGAYVLYNGLTYGKTDTPFFILGLIIVPGSNFVIGLINLNKYLQLRGRYSRLFEIQNKLKK